MSLSIQLGNFLYHRAFFLYKPMYSAFKRRQDAFEIQLLRQHINTNDVVLDIGANIGFYANILSRLVGENGKVHCFEPDGKNFAHLQAACKGRRNLVLNNKAVAPESGVIKIYTSKQLNVDHRTYKPEEYDKETEIEAVSMDDYMKGQPVNFIKMDIQGFEMQAIQGMRQILEKNRAVKILSEFWPYGLKKAGSSVTNYYNFLTGHGFNCYLLERTTLKPLDLEKVKALEPLGEERYFNIFAIRGHV